MQGEPRQLLAWTAVSQDWPFRGGQQLTPKKAPVAISWPALGNTGQRWRTLQRAPISDNLPGGVTHSTMSVQNKCDLIAVAPKPALFFTVLFRATARS